MKRTICLSTLLCFILFESLAQKRINNDIKGIIYDKEKTLDLRLMTHGWAANYHKGTLKSYYKTIYYTVGLNSLKHPKETNMSTDFTSKGLGLGRRNYVYGKQNYFYTLQAGLGLKRYYSEKTAKKGVSVGINYAVGLALGLVIPYYLDVSDPKIKGNSSLIRYSSETKNLFLDINRIRGNERLFKGVKNMSLVPGIYVRTGVHLDWGAFDEFLHAVEVGTQVQIFPKKIPIMVNDENKLYFFSLYFSVQIGRRK